MSQCKKNIDDLEYNIASINGCYSSIIGLLTFIYTWTLSLTYTSKALQFSSYSIKRPKVFRGLSIVSHLPSTICVILTLVHICPTTAPCSKIGPLQLNCCRGPTAKTDACMQGPYCQDGCLHTAGWCVGAQTNFIFLRQ